MALKFTYNTKNLIQNMTRSIVDTGHLLANFYQFDEESQNSILENNYSETIMLVAGNLASLVNNTSEYVDAEVLYRTLKRFGGGDFDIRNRELYDKEINVYSKINQKLNNLEDKLGLEHTPENKFILLSSIRYLIGDGADKYVQKVEVVDKSERLEGLLKQHHDIYEIPYDPLTNKNPVLKNGKHKAILTRKELEQLIIKQKINKTIKKTGTATKNKEYALEETINIIYNQETLINHSFPIDVIEDIDKTIPNNIIRTSIINKLLENSKKTKTTIELEGKNRNYLLYNITLNKENIKITGDVGNYFLAKTDGTIKNITVTGNIGERAFKESTAKINGNITAKNIGCCAFQYSSNIINGNITAENIGDWAFLYSSAIINGNITAENIEEKAFKYSSAIINGNITAENIGDWAFEESTAKIDGNIIAENIGDGAFYNSSAIINGNITAENIGNDAFCDSSAIIGGNIDVAGNIGNNAFSSFRGRTGNIFINRENVGRIRNKTLIERILRPHNLKKIQDKIEEKRNQNNKNQESKTKNNK